jgi:hypothetical protein
VCTSSRPTSSPSSPRSPSLLKVRKSSPACYGLSLLKGPRVHAEDPQGDADEEEDDVMLSDMLKTSSGGKKSAVSLHQWLTALARRRA